MEIKPGEKLSEVSIAEEFGISRTPIREAVRKLENEGLINIYPNRFIEVADFSDKDITDRGIIRLFLETAAIKLALFYGSNADFYKLRLLADQCYEAAQAGDRSSRIKLDTAFHLEISKISRNPVLEKYQSQLLMQIELIQAVRYTGSENAVEWVKSHFPIVDAMVARDEALAIQLIREHLIAFYKLDQVFPFLQTGD
jgi:DNA-binding GntR family transcriptional regulator